MLGASGSIVVLYVSCFCFSLCLVQVSAVAVANAAGSGIEIHVAQRGKDGKEPIVVCVAAQH